MKLYWYAILPSAPRLVCRFLSRPAYHIHTVAGSGRPETAARHRSPVLQHDGVAVDRGKSLPSDTDNHRVRKVPTNGIVTTIAGTGQVDPRATAAPAINALLNRPYGLAR